MVVVAGLYLGLDPDSLVTTPRAMVEVTFEGFLGDRHAGLTVPAGVRARRYPPGTPIRNTRQVSLVGEEELARIAEELGVPEVRAEWLGANVLLRGLPHLTALPPGTRLYFASGAALVVDGENLPCQAPGRVLEAHYPDRPGLAAAFVKAALHRRGLVGWVEREGTIVVGDEVEVVPPEPVPLR